ncbi:hypothetical protein DFH94DRAFT_125682 [Russula ochroleuca]|jgi:hypothetical protein|uniref:Uncharacterized protein n=1 Tax=Russula ochroleuca TaxID=152965 RepID=A0A9P5MRC8_9AGAM|nr:hypothetical protein DFH94DRAFT_125682 [Russula ochroleuca]
MSNFVVGSLAVTLLQGQLRNFDFGFISCHRAILKNLPRRTKWATKAMWLGVFFCRCFRGLLAVCIGRSVENSLAEVGRRSARGFFSLQARQNGNGANSAMAATQYHPSPSRKATHASAPFCLVFLSHWLYTAKTFIDYYYSSSNPILSRGHRIMLHDITFTTMPKRVHLARPLLVILLFQGAHKQFHALGNPTQCLELSVTGSDQL